MSTSVRTQSPPTTPTIRDLPSEERPRERLRDYGAVQLSNAELIAILLRTGQSGENALVFASRILARFEGLNGLARASYTDLCSERGVSDAKACQLLADLELRWRASIVSI